MADLLSADLELGVLLFLFISEITFAIHVHWIVRSGNLIFIRFEVLENYFLSICFGQRGNCKNKILFVSGA